MPVVHIPAHWREHTDGRATVEVDGGTVRAVLLDLVRQHPSMRDLLFNDNDIRREMAIAIDAVITENNPLEPVARDAEIRLIPSIAGGDRLARGDRAV